MLGTHKALLIKSLPAVSQTLNDNSHINPRVKARPRQALTELGRSPKEIGCRSIPNFPLDCNVVWHDMTYSIGANEHQASY